MARRYDHTTVHPDVSPNHPLVVFLNHEFCAGASLHVLRMPAPHMHSQIEFNYVLTGSMTYMFDGNRATIDAGQLVLFWGMIPHQVTACAEETTFVCLYLPASMFLALPSLSRLRQAIFRGSLVEARDLAPWDRDVFLRWRQELLTGQAELASIVKDELMARIRRLDRDGWIDLRNVEPAAQSDPPRDTERAFQVEAMAHFIGENALRDISVVDVAKAAGLNANYAMLVFRRNMGMTIKQAITRHRLDMAQSLLTVTDRSVAAIAFDCGYRSLSSFYLAFEGRFGASPAEFRKRRTVLKVAS